MFLLSASIQRTDGRQVAFLLTCIAPLLWGPAFLMQYKVVMMPWALQLMLLPSIVLFLFSLWAAWRLLGAQTLPPSRAKLYSLGVAGIWLLPYVMWGVIDTLSYAPLFPIYLVFMAPIVVDVWLRPGLQWFLIAVAATVGGCFFLSFLLLPTANLASTLLVGLFAVPMWTLYGYGRLTYSLADYFTNAKLVLIVILAAILFCIACAYLLLGLSMRGMTD